MRLTMISIGSTGDVRPYVLLGSELKRRGHQVTIATFANFEQMVQQAGLGFFPIAGDARDMIATLMKPGVKGPAYLAQVNKSVKDIAPIMLRDLMRAGEGADALCCTFFGSVFYSVAEKYRIPCIQTHYYPMDKNRLTPISSAPGLNLGKGWYYTSYRVGYLLISLLEKHLLTRWREENNLRVRSLRTTPDYQLDGHEIPVIYAISPFLLPMDPSWGTNIHLSGFWWDENPAPWKAPQDLEAFFAEGSQPIYIGFGSMASGDMRKTLTTVLNAVHTSGIRAVISRGWSEELSSLPNSKRVFFCDFVPHDWLFPRVKAVVHHGGAGTTAAGLRYGKPTLIIPFGGDQPFWGKRVYELNCGPKPILRENLTSANLGKALTMLNETEAYRVQAESLGMALRNEHGLQRAADIIEEEVQKWNR